MNAASPDSPSILPEDQYDVAVVGHANVDIFFTLSEDDPDWRLNTKTNELAFTYGEKVAVKEAQYAMGGNGQNVAVGLARLGYKVALLEEIGGDAFAQDIIKNLEQNNVDTSRLVHKPEKRTSIGVVMNVAGDRTILSQHVEHQHQIDINKVAPRLIYLTSLGPVWEEAYTTVLDFAADNGVPIAFNPGSSQLNNMNDIVLRGIRQAHILCVNLDEAHTILEHTSPKGKHAKLSVEDVMAKVAELGPKIVVITDGKNGSYARAEDGRSFYQEVVPASVVERTGAGDSFTAGLLGAALSGKSLQQAMYWGAKNAASVVGQVGSQPGLLNREQMESTVDPLLVDLGTDQQISLFQMSDSNSLAQKLFTANLDDLNPEQVAQLQQSYQLMFDAVKEALTLGVVQSTVVVEVDHHFGHEIHQQASQSHISTAATWIIDNNKEETDPAEIQQLIDSVKPTYLSVFIEFNPGEAPASRKHKKNTLKLLVDKAHQSGVKVILDLSVPPQSKQLDQVKGDIDAFNKSLKPDITVKTIAEFHQAGIEPDIWRFEPATNLYNYNQYLKEIRKADYQQRVGAIISGQFETDTQIIDQIKTLATEAGVIGFTASQAIYRIAVGDFVTQEASALQAKNRIAQEFLHLYQSYRDVVANTTPADALAAPAVEEAVDSKEYEAEPLQAEQDQAEDVAEPVDEQVEAVEPEKVDEPETKPMQNPFRPADMDDEVEDQPRKGLFAKLFKR